MTGDVVDHRVLVGVRTIDRVRRSVARAGITTATRPLLNGVVPLRVRRPVMGFMGRVSSPLPRGARVTTINLGGVPAWRVEVGSPTPGRVLFALHGGGYNYGSIGTHGGTYARMAAQADAVLVMPDYRLIPEHPSTAPLEDAIAAWTALTEGGEAEAVAMTGDSAGGGLALGLACEIRDRGLPAPRLVVLHSPWVDADPSLVRPTDAILGHGAMRVDGALWRDGSDHLDPVLSPIHRPLHDLPPMLVQWGDNEALAADAERLVPMLHAAGTEVTAEAYAGLWHVAFLHTPGLPEANAWVARSSAMIRGALDG